MILILKEIYFLSFSPMNKQITLFNEDKTYREIKKHSSMVQMNNITTLQERKSLNSLIRVAKDILKREPDKRVFSCDIGIVKRLSGMKRSDNETLKSALENLSHTTVKYNIFGKDDAHERGVFSVLSMAKIKTK